jgi:hypothetical protein
VTHDEFKEIVLLLEAHWHLDEPAEEVYALYWHELQEFEYAHVQAAINAIARSGKTRIPLAGEIRRKLVELRIDAPTWAEAIKHFLHARHGIESFVPPETCLDGNANCDGSGWATEEEDYEVGGRQPCECSPTEIDRSRKMALLTRGETEPCSLGICDGSGFVRATRTETTLVAKHCSCWPKVRARRFVNMHPILVSFIDLVTWGEIGRMLHGDSTLEAQMRVKYDQHVRERVEQESLRGLHAPGLAKIERANTDEPRALPSRPRGELEAVAGSVGSEIDRLGG